MTTKSCGLFFRFSRRGTLPLLAAALVASAVWSGNTAAAEKKAGAQQGGAQQIALTGKLIEQFIKAHGELNPLLDKLGASGDKGDPKLEAAGEAAAKKYGFKDLDEYEDVEHSILMVMHGIDSKTRQYTDPVASIKAEIAEVQADKKISEADRKKELEDLNNELSRLEPVKYPENIKLVLKYFDQLDKLFPLKSQQK
jgi:hypothetical protein